MPRARRTRHAKIDLEERSRAVQGGYMTHAQCLLSQQSSTCGLVNLWHPRCPLTSESLAPAVPAHPETRKAQCLLSQQPSTCGLMSLWHPRCLITHAAPVKTKISSQQSSTCGESLAPTVPESLAPAVPAHPCSTCLTHKKDLPPLPSPWT